MQEYDLRDFYEHSSGLFSKSISGTAFFACENEKCGRYAIVVSKGLITQPSSAPPAGR